MKLSRKWLNEFVDLPLSEYSARDFAEAMTVSGSKVEMTEDLWENCLNVCVGRVTAMEKHPDSDHMWVCTVDVGAAEPLADHLRDVARDLAQVPLEGFVADDDDSPMPVGGGLDGHLRLVLLTLGFLHHSVHGVAQ